MTVTVLGWASAAVAPPDGRSDAELLGPVVDAALAGSGVDRRSVDVVVSAGSELGSGMVGGVMGCFDVLPGWPPRRHGHLDGDGAAALYEAWVRLRAGDGRVALVAAVGRPLAVDPLAVASLALDPFVELPLGVTPRVLAALQASAAAHVWSWSDRDLAAMAVARRGSDDPDLVAAAVAAAPVATPLRAHDCPQPCAGAAAVVLAADAGLATAAEAPVRVIDMVVACEVRALGARPAHALPALAAVARRPSLARGPVDVVAVAAPYTHQEPLVRAALGGDPHPDEVRRWADLVAAAGVGAGTAGAASGVVSGAASSAASGAGSGSRQGSAGQPGTGLAPWRWPAVAGGLMTMQAAMAAVAGGVTTAAVGHGADGSCLDRHVVGVFGPW